MDFFTSVMKSIPQDPNNESTFTLAVELSEGCAILRTKRPILKDGVRDTSCPISDWESVLYSIELASLHLLTTSPSLVCVEGITPESSPMLVLCRDFTLREQELAHTNDSPHPIGKPQILPTHSTLTPCHDPIKQSWIPQLRHLLALPSQLQSIRQSWRSQLPSRQTERGSTVRRGWLISRWPRLCGTPILYKTKWTKKSSCPPFAFELGLSTGPTCGVIHESVVCLAFSGMTWCCNTSSTWLFDLIRFFTSRSGDRLRSHSESDLDDALAFDVVANKANPSNTDTSKQSERLLEHRDIVITKLFVQSNDMVFDYTPRESPIGSLVLLLESLEVSSNFVSNSTDMIFKISAFDAIGMIAQQRDTEEYCVASKLEHKLPGSYLRTSTIHERLKKDKFIQILSWNMIEALIKTTGFNHALLFLKYIYIQILSVHH